MTTAIVPFASIGFLERGQPITYESQFGTLRGIVGDVREGRHVGIQNLTGEWLITPEHQDEGHLVAEIFA